MRSLSRVSFVLLSSILLFMFVLSQLNAQETAVAPTYTPVTTITVDSTSDPDDSDSRTCLTYTPCTLRRAVIQARNLPANQKPVLIAFNIPTSDPGYNATLQIWKIQFNDISSTSNASLRYLNCSIIIDGSTQPGGRTNGPKIMLVGPGTGQWDGLKLGENVTQGANEIHGLGFQKFKTHIYASSSSNIIADNWFGLNDDGTGIVLRGGGEDDGSGNTAVSVVENVTNNVIQDNVFTGLAGVAAAINGDDTTFSGNYVGTIADGTVPGKLTDPSLICSPVDWQGGSGISIGSASDGNLVEDNIFAGLRIAVEPPTTQADTIRMGGDNHIIRNNKIGVDSADTEIGVCGRGIFLQGSTQFNQITNNRIIRPELSAISLNDTPVVSTSDANTLRGNIIKKLTPWGAIEGNPAAEDAIQIGPGMPTEFRVFKPAQVTNIDGQNVSGTAGASSPCPNCIVELFRDDTDAITETLQSLAVVTANANGNWTAVLPAELTTGQGIRTTSTSAQYNTILGWSAGTTTGLSVLYTSAYEVYLPMIVK